MSDTAVLEAPAAPEAAVEPVPTLGADLARGTWGDNPILVLMLGLCPTLAVTNSMANGLSMGLATLGVLVGSNLVISLIKDVVPKRIRIPCYIVVIATFVTLADQMIAAISRELYMSLGIFIKLIVVNCIILGRAEAFASRNSVWMSFRDGLVMGLGFALVLLVLSAIREVSGMGTFFGRPVLPAMIQPSLVMILPPGGFVALAMLMAGMNAVNRWRSA